MVCVCRRMQMKLCSLINAQFLHSMTYMFLVMFYMHTADYVAFCSELHQSYGLSDNVRVPHL